MEKNDKNFMDTKTTKSFLIDLDTSNTYLKEQLGIISNAIKTANSQLKDSGNIRVRSNTRHILTNLAKAIITVSVKLVLLASIYLFLILYPLVIILRAYHIHILNTLTPIGTVLLSIIGISVVMVLVYLWIFRKDINEYYDEEAKDDKSKNRLRYIVKQSVFFTIAGILASALVYTAIWWLLACAPASGYILNILASVTAFTILYRVGISLYIKALGKEETSQKNTIIFMCVHTALILLCLLCIACSLYSVYHINVSPFHSMFYN
ncbi:hypothetical protein NEOKW01_0895 [Nematocida sp. AWRm80]|nr:hypothetical protein NEOKW01_0895 [Nematocida sp. AWRm80]